MSGVETQTLAEFLLARIADDPRLVAEWHEVLRRIAEAGRSECSGYHDPMGREAARSLGLEPMPHYPDPDWAHCDGCAAAESADADRQWTLRVLATVYAGHPDYREEWRP